MLKWTTPSLASSLLCSAEALEGVLVWAVAGLSDDHAVRVFSNQGKANNKPKTELQPILFCFLTANSNLWLLLVAMQICVKSCVTGYWTDELFWQIVLVQPETHLEENNNEPSFYNIKN